VQMYIFNSQRGHNVENFHSEGTFSHLKLPPRLARRYKPTVRAILVISETKPLSEVAEVAVP